MSNLFHKHILVLNDEDDFTSQLYNSIQRMGRPENGIKLYSIDNPRVVYKSASKNLFCALVAFKTCYNKLNDEAIIQFRKKNPDSPIILINNAQTVSSFDCSDELLEALPKRVSRRLLKVDARQVAVSLISMLDAISQQNDLDSLRRVASVS